MRLNQLTKYEKINVRNYIYILYGQREQAKREENVSLEIDTTNMLIGATNVLRILGLEDLAEY